MIKHIHNKKSKMWMDSEGYWNISLINFQQVLKLKMIKSFFFLIDGEVSLKKI